MVVYKEAVPSTIPNYSVHNKKLVQPVKSTCTERCSGISLDLLLFIKKLQPNSLFLKDYFSVWGCRLQKNAVKQMKSAWTTMTAKGRAKNLTLKLESQKKLHVSNFLKPYHIYSCFSETMQFPSKSELQYIESYSFIIQLSLALF